MNDRPTSADQPRVIVAGSVNQDSFVYVDEFPAPGQTIFAGRAAEGLGGKGANQAVAAAAVGASVTFVGAVGADVAGAAVTGALLDEGVDISRLVRLQDHPTGVAYITVAASGENTIVVSSGANSAVRAEQVAVEVESALDGSSGALLLSQGELPADVVDAIGEIAVRRGCRFVLNLAPVIEVAESTLSAASVLVLNEGEASQLHARLYPELAIPGASMLARQLQKGLDTVVVVTLGAEGAVVAERGRSWAQAAPETDAVVDTTGAGDAFTGALAASLASGLDIVIAVRAGVSAGSAAVSSAGTVASYSRVASAQTLASNAPEPRFFELVAE